MSSESIASLEVKLEHGEATPVEAIAYLERLFGFGVWNPCGKRAIEIVKKELDGVKTEKPLITAWDDPQLQAFNGDCLVAVFPDSTVWPLWHAEAADHIIFALRDLAQKHQAKLRLTCYPGCFYHIREWHKADSLVPVWETLKTDEKLQARAVKFAPKEVARHGYVPVA